MSVQTAGYFRDPDGVMRLRCACGHPVHFNWPCTVGVATGRDQTETPCGSPPTCRLCLNMGFVTVRRGDDEKQTYDCPSCTDGTGAA